ncbi:glycoside hydrolase family 2 protein [Terrabacter sp. GCM10028922]|uniref:glycoside hydrolase family 2 protein n=1 Tax=Terrabacter sp. GCM10028922 TaxID=3273428 RepID=UPI00360CC5B9
MIRRTCALSAALVTVVASTFAAGTLGAPGASAAPVRVAAQSALPGSGTPPHGDREPADTTITNIDGTSVVTQYGGVVPAFDGYDTPQPTRGYAHLDGPWSFRFDPDGVGERQGWQRQQTDTSGWDTIEVPSSWDLKDTPGFGSYDGTNFGQGTAFRDGYAWYRVTARIPEAWAGDQVRLSFLGVNYRADIWVNGRYVGAHEGGHTPFALPVTQYVRHGQDATIAVRVHRRASYTSYQPGGAAVTDPLAVPWKPVDYWPYAGITRSTWLEAVPTVSIPKILVSARDGRLDARVVVENRGTDPARGRVTFNPGAAAGAASVTTPVDVPAQSVRAVRVNLAIPTAPQWSTDSPQLITATAQLRLGSTVSARPVTDQLTATYGVRSVDVADATLKVTGAPVFLKGLNWHEETAVSGRSMTRAEYDAELAHVKDTGANFVRNAVYNRHPYAYRWTDEHGVYVMDDIDNMWMNTEQEALQTSSYGLSRALATTMAWNQHNNPSVIVWGLQNESEIDGGGAPVYRAWLKDMKDAVKAVDLQDRPVTWASSTTNDPAFDLADVIGFNEYFGYFYGGNTDLGPAIDAVHATHPKAPILITENGSWSYLGHHGPATEQGTEEWQAANLESRWAQSTARKDYVAGYTFWVLKDYKQRSGYNQTFNGISAMGLLGFDSTTRRAAYDTFAAAHNPR